LQKGSGTSTYRGQPTVQANAVGGNAEELTEQEKHILNQPAHEGSRDRKIVSAALYEPNEASLHDLEAPVYQMEASPFWASQTRTPGSEPKRGLKVLPVQVISLDWHRVDPLQVARQPKLGRSFHPPG
jgi:hypothetical protein